MRDKAQYIVDQSTWIGRELKKKDDKVMLTEAQAKYVPVTRDPKWSPPAPEVAEDMGEQDPPADTTKAPKKK
jgi:hypothetical protein